jgi:hypothetical protein
MFIIISMCDIFQPEYYSYFMYHVCKCPVVCGGNTWILHSMLSNQTVCSNYIQIFNIYYANMEWCTLIFHYINFNMKNIYQHFLNSKT